MKKHPKSKLIATITSENKLGFRIPSTEKVVLYSYNKSKRALEKEWNREGVAAIKAMLQNRELIKVESIKFTDMFDKELT